MKTLFRILTLAVVLVVAQGVIYAQSQPTFTTLSSAITAPGSTTMKVASNTGFTASNQATGAEYYALIESELVRVKAVNSTIITIERGQNRTAALPHPSGAYVFVGPFASSMGLGAGQSGGPFIATMMSGACTRSSYPILPLIQPNPNALGGQAMYDCLGGTWAKQTLVGETSINPPAVCPFDTTALIALTTTGLNFGTNTTTVAGTWFYGTVWVPRTDIYTGAQALQGATAGSDKFIATLFDTGGNSMFNSAVAGVSTTTQSTFLVLPFSATKVITGPARYWVGIQSNGTTDKLRTIPTGNLMVLGSSVTGTFGTIPPSLIGAGIGTAPLTTALPTTGIANTAPIACLYR